MDKKRDNMTNMAEGDFEGEFKSLRAENSGLGTSSLFSSTNLFVGEIEESEAPVTESATRVNHEAREPVTVKDKTEEPKPILDSKEPEKKLSFEELKKQLDQMNKDASKAKEERPASEAEEKCIQHQLTFQFSQSWNDYFGIFKDKLLLNGKTYHSLSEQSFYKGGEVEVLFVGDTYDQENQGDDEDMLAKMMGAMKLGKDEALRLFYDPSFDQESYFTAFFHEIALVKPKFVVSMGAALTNLLLKKQIQLKKVRGCFYDIELTDGSGQTVSFKLIPIFHPEYLKINQTMKKNTWEDLQELMKEMGKS